MLETNDVDVNHFVKITIFLSLLLIVITPILSPVFAQSDSLETPSYLKYYLLDLDKSVTDVYEKKPQVNFKYSAPLLDYSKSRLKRNVEFGVKEGYVVVAETVYGRYPIRKPYVLTLPEYMDIITKRNSMEKWFEGNWKELAREDRPKGGAGGLVPDIEMPVELKGKIFDWLFVWTPEERERTAGRLRVTGYQKITFGGQVDWDNRPVKEGEHKSKFPKLDMEQELKVHLSGRVGDKIEVLVDHDSTRDQLNKNTIRIRYEGDEDEIIQEIEAGNTNLSLGRSPQFIQGGFSHQGLFGIRTSLKMGNLNVTMIASKEESQSKSKHYEGKAESQVEFIKNKDYIRREFYYVDQPQEILPENQRPVPTSITVWLDDNDGTNDVEQGATPGVAYSDFLSYPTTPDTTKEYWEGNFVRLIDGEDYYIDDTSPLKVIQLTRRVGGDDILAVTYSREDGTQVGSSDTDNLILRMIKPRNPTPENPETWNCEAKNYYDIGERDISEEGFQLDIIKVETGTKEDTLNTHQGDRSFMEIFNLDTDNDGVLDYGANPDFYMTGILRFPLFMQDANGQVHFVPNPFDPPDNFAGLSEENHNPVIYNTPQGQLKDTDVKFKLYMRFKSTLRTFNLGINIVEGSEVVRKNGEVLKKGVDYDIIYETGTLTLREEPLPSDDISVDYEYSPFMAQSQKTLLGFRAEYNINSRSSIGTTWMYKSEKTLEERPKVGNESTRYIVGDVDANFELNPSIMTDAVNLLPFIDTDRKSSLTFSGEAAVSFPNPNTSGDAYIDDMEGIKQSNTISIMRETWVPASIPPPRTIADSSYTAKLRWYNPADKIRTEEIFLNTEGKDEGDDLRHVMNMEFIPSNGDTSWAGVMKLVSKGGTDFTEMEYLEVWVNGDQGELNFDMGSDVSEDYRVRGIGKIYNRQTGETEVKPSYNNLNSEDMNGDGKKDFDEDMGVDGFEDGELHDDGNPDGGNSHLPGDNWDYDPTLEDEDPRKYEDINGTEENNRLDTEDLDENGNLNTTERYFRYTIDLSDTTSPYIIQNNMPVNGWKLYQIPIHTPHEEHNSPSLGDIRYFRMWLTGVQSDSIQMQVGSIEVTGNKWLANEIRYLRDETGIGDGIVPEDELGEEEEFEMITKNNREHTEYSPPAGVEIREDDQGNEEQEQSLGIRFKNLTNTHYASGYLDFYNAINMLNYGALSFYVNGYNKQNSLEEVEFFMRIGGSSPSDTSNYYEYRQTITLSQNVNWHEIDVDFQDWTGLKLDKPDTVEFIRKDNFIVKGDPSLTAIRRITVGIASKNPDGVSGEIWVDDVRVSDVNRQKGFAFYGGLSADFGGFLQFTLDASWRDAEFSTLRGRTGSRMEEFSYGINNARIKLDEFFPRSWGLNMPLSGSLRKSVKKPKFQTNSDIELPDEESYNQRTETTNKSLNFNYRKSQKSENPLIRIFVDPFSFGVKANQRTNYSPTAIDSSVEYSGNIDYNYTFGDNSVNIPLLGAFSYSPSKLTFSARYSERDQTHYTILQDGTKRQETRRPTNSLDGRADFSYSPFRTINTGYSLSVKNDRTYESDAEILGFNLGTETDRQQRVDLSYRPNLPSFLSSLRPGVSYNVSYNEQNRPLTTTIGDSIYWQTNISNNSTAQGDLTFDLKVLTSNLKSVLGVSGKGDRKRPEREREMKREDFEDGKAPPPYEDLEKEKEEEREKEEEKKKEDDGGGFNPMNLVFGTTFDLLDRIAPIKGTYRLTRSSRFRDVSGSPDFNYQLGLTDSLSTGIDGEFEERSEASDYSFGSGVRLFSNLNINADYRYNETTRWLPSTSNTTMETTWPSVSLNLNQLEQYPLIRSLVTSANLSSRYTVRDKEVQTLGEGITSETHTENWRPLVNFSSTWFRKLRIDLGANMSNTESRSFTGTGTVNQEETIGYNAKIDFSFSAKEGFSIPIWKLKEKVIRFESDVRFSLPISYDISKSQTVGQADPTRHTEKFSINPSMSYDFSQSITGGLRGDYSKTNDKKSGLETQMIRINIWMTFNF